MHKRRIAAALLAAMLLLGSTTAFAAEEPSSGESEYTDSIIQIEDGTVTVISGEAQTIGGEQYYPTDIKTISSGDLSLIIKSFEVPANVNPEQLASDFEQGGIRYTKQEILKNVLPDEKETKLASQTISLECTAEEEKKLLQVLSPLMDYEEDGFVGQLQLDTSSICTEVTDTQSYRYLVTETKEMTGLDRNDTAYIPKTANKNGVKLTLNDVDWTVMGCGESRGRLVPSMYSAQAQYSGYAYGSKATGYLATATYVGEVTRTTPGLVRYSIVYGVDSSVVNKEISAFDKQSSPFIILGVVLIAGLIGGGIYLFLQKRGPRPPKAPKQRSKTRIYMPRETAEEEISDGGVTVDA